MAFSATPRGGASFSRTGHRLGDFNKKTSQGDGHRKAGSFKRKTKKRYRGQGK